MLTHAAQKSTSPIDDGAGLKQDLLLVPCPVPF